MNLAASVPVVLVVLPFAGASVAFIWPARRVPVTYMCGAGTLAAAIAAAVLAAQEGLLRHELGGWAIPLGIGWHLDDLAAAMLLLTAVVGSVGVLYRHVEVAADAPSSTWFEPLWLFLWGGLNALFLAADLFNLYIVLELVALATVALIALAGGRALAAAWRYFVATLLGSSVYLLGVALLYGSYGTLDIAATQEVLQTGLTAVLAALLITLALLLKAAVFPLHFWLPAAHGRAPTAVSAMLSGVVVAAAFYLLIRLWLEPFMPLLDSGTPLVLGGLGAAALFWGGVQALLQRRLKMLVAYSTISQLGLVLLVFPLIATETATTAAWRGAVAVVIAHGFAKAALFLAAGAIAWHRGHDRIGRPGCPRQGPVMALLAFGLASATLIGLPPTGGFVGKWWLLQSALVGQAWVWALAILAGSLLTAAYLYRAFDGPLTTHGKPARRPPRALSGLALLLAVIACALGPALALTGGWPGMPQGLE